MIRVAFPTTRFDSGWLGGINYLRSLFHALVKHPEYTIQPVLVVGEGQRTCASKAYPMIQEIVETPLLSKRRLPHLFRRIVLRVSKNDALLDRFYQKHNIQIASHASALGAAARTPSLVWIPDFQHVHLPHYFSSKERNKRNEHFRAESSRASRIIVSSQDACSDYKSFMTQALDKVRVLPFIPSINLQQVISLDELKRIYFIPDSFIFFPGQMWIHKNHITVVEALAKLKQQGKHVSVVCTGSTSDFRHPEHHESIVSAIKKAGLGGNLQILGVVPYEHMVSLLLHSRALLNPSLFEGWSTTVEEAKLLGKRLILSELNVHIEQAGKDALYFKPLSSTDSAEAIWSGWTQPIRPFSYEDCQNRLNHGTRRFAKDYSTICKEVLPEGIGSPN